MKKLHENNSGNESTEDGYETYVALSAYKGHLDREFVESINKFWLKFSPPSPNAHYTIAILYIIIMIVGYCGNLFVIFMFIKCRSLRTPANILVVNLAVSDFLIVAKTPIVIYNSFYFGPALGDIACRIYGFIGGLSGTASILTLTSISIDRYYVIVYPLNPLKSATKLRAYILIFLIWIYSLVFSIMPFLNIGLSKYVPEGYLTSCSFDYLDDTTKARIFMFLFFIFAWMVPFIIITFCYVNILKVVTTANNIQSNKDNYKIEIKLAIIIIIVIVLWFIAWTPYSIVALLGITGNQHLITPFISMVPALFCKTAACINPYIYAITHPRFRIELIRLCCGEQTKYFYTRNSITQLSFRQYHHQQQQQQQKNRRRSQYYERTSSLMLGRESNTDDDDDGIKFNNSTKRKNINEKVTTNAITRHRSTEEQQLDESMTRMTEIIIQSDILPQSSESNIDDV